MDSVNESSYAAADTHATPGDLQDPSFQLPLTHDESQRPDGSARFTTAGQARPIPQPARRPHRPRTASQRCEHRGGLAERTDATILGSSAESACSISCSSRCSRSDNGTRPSAPATPWHCHRAKNYAARIASPVASPELTSRSGQSKVFTGAYAVTSEGDPVGAQILDVLRQSGSPGR
jgi:hypothetical protein